MLFLLLLITIFQLWTENIKAQKFRIDYMYAQGFQTFYSLHDIAMNWERARQICEAERTELLIPFSLDEVENLKLLMSNMRSHYTAIFIGLHDKFSEGNFIDLRGEPIVDTFLDLLWAPGRPDNINGSEHCVVMTREGMLDDRRCSNTYPFVCKIFVNGTKYNDECDSYDDGFKLRGNGSCYKFHEEPLTWDNAYMTCQIEQGHLVIINSEEEAILVTEYLNNHLQNKAPNPNILFIGFSDLMFQYEYRTIQGQTLEEANYSTWDPFEEDISEMRQKRCGAVSRSGKLLITWCNIPAMFICERAVNTTISIHNTTTDKNSTIIKLL